MLRLNGEVRGLLGLQQQTARANGVNHAGGHEEHVARLHRNAVDEGGHALLVVFGGVHRALKFLAADLPGEAEVEAGVGSGGQDQPGLRLAVGAVKQPAGVRAGGMHLHRQADGAVQELDQHAQILALAQALLFVGGEQFAEGHAVLLADGDALQGIGVARIDGAHRRGDPLLRIEAILGGIAHEIVEQFAAQIDAEDPVPAEKDRMIVDCHGCCSFGYCVMVPSRSQRSSQWVAPGQRNTCPLTRRQLRSSVDITCISASVSGSSVTQARLDT